MTKKKVPPVEVIKAEIPLIEKIISDETWHEGKRRNHSIEPSDKIVMEKVSLVIMSNSSIIRQEAEQKIKTGNCEYCGNKCGRDNTTKNCKEWKEDE